MKITTAKKIQSILGEKLLTHWAKSHNGFTLSHQKVFINVGNVVTGHELSVVNLDTVGAKELSQCITASYSERVTARASTNFESDRAIRLGNDFMEHLALALKPTAKEARAIRSYSDKVLVTNDGYTTKVAGTDSFYLFEGQDESPSQPFTFVLEEKVARVLIALFGNKTPTLAYLSYDNTTLQLVNGDITIDCRTSQVKYPKYETVIPSSEKNKYSDFFRHIPAFKIPKDSLAVLVQDGIEFKSAKPSLQTSLGKLYFETNFVEFPKTIVQPKYLSWAREFASSWSQKDSDSPILCTSKDNRKRAVMVPIQERSA
jgi:hypothetical protein